MSYKSLETIIREISTQELSEAALGNYKGLAALASRKSGDEKSVMTRAADMMKKGQTKDLNMFMKAMDQSTHKAIMPFVDKKYYKALHEDIEELDEANPTGLKIYHKDKSTGKSHGTIVFTARDAASHEKDLKKSGHSVTHRSLMYGTKEGPKKSVNEEMDLDFLDEKKLTPAELKKREEIAKAIERDNPDMEMGKKMAIATAQAKKVTEATVNTADIQKKKNISQDDKEKLSKVADMMRKERETIAEDGHEDVMSAKNQVKIAMAALQKMDGELNKLGEEDNLPTWWTNKVAIAVDKLDGMADYLDTQVEGTTEESFEDNEKRRAKARADMAAGKYNKDGSRNVVKLKGFGPDAAKGNMSNPAARAALMKKEGQVNEAGRVLASQFPKGTKVKVKNARKYDALQKDGVGGEVLGVTSNDYIMVKVGRGQMNVHPKDLVKESLDEAIGTAAKYADKKGTFGGKYTHTDRALDMKGDKFSKWRDKQQAKRDAQHKAQDPSMAKKGYAQNVVDRDKAQKKAAKKGLGHQNISHQQGNSVKRGNLPEAEAFGREALQKRFEKETEKKTGETLKQRQDWYKNNAAAVKKRMQQNNESNIAEVRGGADEPDKHIIMQLRKAQDVDGNHDITFRGGHKAKVAKKHIDKILKTHDHPSTKPVTKRMMRVAISKSPKHLSAFADRLKEDYDESGREKIHTKKADFVMKKVRLPDGRMVYRKVKKEVDIEK